MTSTSSFPQAYLVGGGIASLAAAVFLIRDGHLPPANVHIFEQLSVSGGSLDGMGDPESGYVTRGGRMLEDGASQRLRRQHRGDPTIDDPELSVREEITQFNEAHPTEARARLVDKSHTILNAADLGFNARDRREMAHLMALPERMIGTRRIEDFFSEHFFRTNFWFMWRTTFAFQNWHSAIELRRYFLRFIQEFPRLHTLAGVRRTKLNQYDSVIRPVVAWLEHAGVTVEHGTRVTGVDFSTSGPRRVNRLHTERDGQAAVHELGFRDLAFLTLGSMTADTAYGDDDHAPELIRSPADGSWQLWEAIATQASDFGRPNAFAGNIAETKWESFTLTMRDPLLLKRIEEFSGNQAGSGALMTFTDSAWLMSIVVPHQPHFDGQPDDVFTLWGYGLFLDRPGDYVSETMAQATGQQILTELIGQLGFNDVLAEVRSNTTVIPVMMPYITSQFERRAISDRPLVVPAGSTNFAFLGQFTEIPQDVVFTVEYSVRGAMHAVYELLEITLEIPPVHHGIADPKTALAALRTAFA